MIHKLDYATSPRKQQNREIKKKKGKSEFPSNYSFLYFIIFLKIKYFKLPI